MKVSKILLNILSVVCFLYGAIYVFSLVFIPVGIYCFLAGRRFSFKAEHLDNDMFMSNKEFKVYVIFASIACFPFGLISIFPYLILTGNNIRISNPQGLHLQKDEKSVEENKKINNESVEELKNGEQGSELENVEVQNNAELSEEEKHAKFQKLQNFRDKGIITEEELELAREQLFGKNQ